MKKNPLDNLIFCRYHRCYKRTNLGGCLLERYDKDIPIFDNNWNKSLIEIDKEIITPNRSCIFLDSTELPCELREG